MRKIKFEHGGFTAVLVFFKACFQTEHAFCINPLAGEYHLYCESLTSPS